LVLKSHQAVPTPAAHPLNNGIVKNAAVIAKGANFFEYFLISLCMNFLLGEAYSWWFTKQNSERI